jgi:hypothetical protein
LCLSTRFTSLGREAWLGEEDKTAEFGGEAFSVEGVRGRDKEIAKKALDFALQVMKERSRI